MQLTVSDVARLCQVSENKVFKWVSDESLPAERVNDVFHVNPAELLEWAAMRKLPVSPAVFQAMNGDSVGKNGLSDALEFGGVIHDVGGDDRESVFKSVVASLPLPATFDRQSLVHLLVARETFGSTSVGDGIAIPHPRNPVILPGAERLLRLCFLAHGVEFTSSDGKRIDTLFLMICPTVRDHLQLVTRLASLLCETSIRELLRSKPSQEAVLKEVRRFEVLLPGDVGQA